MGRRDWLALFFGLAVIAGLTLLRAADPYALVVASAAGMVAAAALNGARLAWVSRRFRSRS